VAELQTLKNRKGQLETRMHMLESNKDELLGQLETLLKQSQSNKQRAAAASKAAASANKDTTAPTATVSFLSSPRSLTINSTQKYNSLINNNGPGSMNSTYHYNGFQNACNNNNNNNNSNNDVSNSPLNAINVTVPGLSDMYNGFNPGINYHHPLSTTSNNTSPNNNNNKSSLNNIVPQVSAATAMQMPHQSRSSAANGASHRSWSTPSNNAAPQFELHPTRLVHQNAANGPMNYQQQQPYPTMSQQHSPQQQSEFIAAKNRVLATTSVSLAPSAHSSLLSINALSAFCGNGTGSQNGIGGSGSAGDLRNLRNDLLIAADSVTSAMQNLVKELHSETGDNNNNNINSSCYTTDDEDTTEYAMDVDRQREMMLMLTNRTHNNHFTIQQQQQHVQFTNNNNNNNQPPPHMFTSLSANTTPLLCRKPAPQPTSANGLLLNDQGPPGYSLSATNTPLHGRYNNDLTTSTSQPTGNDEHSSKSNMTKVNLIKQIARTFKDMNNNSEYDDVVSELEAELASCGEQLDDPPVSTALLPTSSAAQQPDELAKLVMNMNMSLSGRNMYDELSQSGSAAQPGSQSMSTQLVSLNNNNNDDDIEDLIYENYLLSDSFINEIGHKNASAAMSAANHNRLLNEADSYANNNANSSAESNNNTNNSESNEQVAQANFESQQQADCSWRRELEQVLIAENNEITTDYVFTSSAQNGGSGDDTSVVDELVAAHERRNSQQQQRINDFLASEGYDSSADASFEQARDSAGVVEQLLQEEDEGEDPDFDELLNRALNENKSANQQQSPDNDDDFSLL
jgi:hypothetical protein